LALVWPAKPKRPAKRLSTNVSTQSTKTTDTVSRCIPGGQGPSQEADCDVVDNPNVPATHGVGAEDPCGQKLPVPHGCTVPLVDPRGHQKPAAHGPVKLAVRPAALALPAPYQNTGTCLIRPGRTVPTRRRPSTRRSSRLEHPSDPADRRPSRQHSTGWSRLQSDLRAKKKVI
jgi:hypothetical protein